MEKINEALNDFYNDYKYHSNMCDEHMNYILTYQAEMCDLQIQLQKHIDIIMKNVNKEKKLFYRHYALLQHLKDKVNEEIKTTNNKSDIQEMREIINDIDEAITFLNDRIKYNLEAE